MSQKLTDDQINRLFVFCRKHYVLEYDLQVELVDHLASSIEDQWEMDNELSFDQALKNSFKKFGIYGFSKIKDQKRKELERKYNRLLWKYLLEFFSWPKIVLTAAITMLLFTLFRVIEDDTYLIIAFFIFLIGFIIFYFIRVYPRHIKIEVTEGKRFMILERLKRGQQMAGVFLQIPVHIVNVLNFSGIPFLPSIWVEFLLSLSIVIYSVGFYGELIYVPQKVKEHFMEQFAEFAT